MNLSVKGFIFGVLVAVAAILLKEIIGNLMEGLRFRKKLTSDIKVLVSGFAKHLPELQNLQIGLKDEIEVSPIWDNEYSLIDKIYSYSHYLRTNEFERCAIFYDTFGKISEIRKQYNESIKNIIINKNDREQYQDIAAACLKDLRKTYQQAIIEGCGILLELNKNHWFLSIDKDQFQTILADLGS